ncbi:MAG: hypothetical protein K9G67_07280 [Bacteroidales bacterium]|nr:hypothetical protein [Bacteroidales bacterium]MCF8351832.1 hypothetical protein [Bacteroidales bacterium]MCF8376142.1 hypothetical protein [Bacteroidales bacterium]MCF8402282.1 hypothetical protein [Bacteroidales bacterium]
MSNLEKIKHRLIDRIMVTRNVKFLKAVEELFVSTQEEDVVSLSSEQIDMLAMSDEDIEKGNLISEANLEKKDKEWFG